jgi:DivIVA domain-containing protein
VARKRKRKQDEAEAGAGFEAQVDPGSADRPRLTPVEIQQKVFRLAFRGYNERDVDEFLDRVTEELAALHEENKRLREQVAEGGVIPGDAAAADRQAESIVRQAREHAARLVEDAERRASAVGEGPAGTGLPASFLLQERQFLQQMASLIQGHAGRLKEEARRARAEAGEAPPPGPAVSEAPASEAEPAPGAAGLVGGAAIGAAAVGASVDEVDEEPPGGSTPEPPPAPGPGPEPVPDQGTPPEESTAQWSPQEEQEAEAAPEPPPPTGGTETPSGGDPVVSAWESAFRREPGDPAFAEEHPRREDQEGEPSLRELFWGEE